jgi:hypothetical protein
MTAGKYPDLPKMLDLLFIGILWFNRWQSEKNLKKCKNFDGLGNLFVDNLAWNC